MTPEAIETCFTTPDGYRFARWSRPIVPVIFGVEGDSLAVVKAAIEATVFASGHKMAETDPELGANLMVFFLRDWDDLSALDNLDAIIPDLGPLLARLKSQRALNYRTFRFDDGGGIRAGFVFLRMSGALAEQPAADLGLEQATKVMLSWSPQAFSETSVLAIPAGGGDAILRPDIVSLLRAAYDPVMPDAANDPSHALRLAARISVGTSEA